MILSHRSGALAAVAALFVLSPSAASQQSQPSGPEMQATIERQLAVIDSALKEDPNNIGMVRMKWLLQLRAWQWKNAMATGEEYVKLDTAAATADYFSRQIGAAQTDSNTKAVVEFASKASQRFPKDDSYFLILAQAYRKMSQPQQSLAAARRAAEINPKNTNAWMFAVVTANDLQEPDTAAMFARKGIESGADKTYLGQVLVGPVGPMVTKAQASRARSDWAAVLERAESVDSIASSPWSKFYIGLAAFQIAADMLNQLHDEMKKAQESNRAVDSDSACARAKQVEDLLATTSTALPDAGTSNAEDARRILAEIRPLNDYSTEIKLAYACR